MKDYKVYEKKLAYKMSFYIISVFTALYFLGYIVLMLYIFSIL